jgi:hypothetical protein
MSESGKGGGPLMKGALDVGKEHRDLLALAF